MAIGSGCWEGGAGGRSCGCSVFWGKPEIRYTTLQMQFKEYNVEIFCVNVTIALQVILNNCLSLT